MSEPIPVRQVVIEAFAAAIAAGLVYWYFGRGIYYTLLFTVLAGTTWAVSRYVLSR